MVRPAERGLGRVTFSNNDKVRSFIAIPVPPDGINILKRTVEQLDSDFGRNVRWVRPEGIHLTLKFMGDIPGDMVTKVDSALPEVAADFAPFSLSLSGLGVFPNARRPRVLWAGITGDMDALSALQLAVDDAVADLGLPREQREFSPHLTLGRVRRETPEGQLRKIGRAMAEGDLSGDFSWQADAVHLMRTELDPAGSRHYLVGAASLGGG
ncbi:MAG: RNA 2',3'-cyclic phosphodiesterase [Chloroflexi bacterium]|nr:RNA 2',3'-cyclic phosphodiesterase [Chloroflexota bacterium]